MKKIIVIVIILTLSLSIFPVSTFGLELNTRKIENNHIGDTLYDFLILTPEFFTVQLQSLKEHKEQHDIATIIVTCDEIYEEKYFTSMGRDNPEKIKYFIKNAHENWGVNYVMLVGGKEEFPVRYTVDCYWGKHYSYISDLYYADIYDDEGQFCSWDSNENNIFSGKNMDGVEDLVDLYPDVSIGRLLCHDQSDLIIVIEKIIEYENNAYGEEWFSNIILCGGDDARLKWQEKELPGYFNREGEIVWEGEYMCDVVAECLPQFSAEKIYATGIFRSNIKFLTVNNINRAINKGAGFLYFVGHGSTNMAIKTNFPLCENIWLPFPLAYYSSHLTDLHNGEKLPVAVFAGCNCGNFNYSESPIAWEIIQKENCGAIASFAATTGSIILMSSLCTDTFTGFLSLEVFRLFAAGMDTIGDIWKATITNYLNNEEACYLGDAMSKLNWRNELANNYVLEEWVLFGDPTLKIGGYT